MQRKTNSGELKFQPSRLNLKLLEINSLLKGAKTRAVVFGPGIKSRFNMGGGSGDFTGRDPGQIAVLGDDGDFNSDILEPLPEGLDLLLLPFPL